MRESKGWKSNLILNRGLQGVGERRWVECFTAAYAGSVASSNWDDSGATTATSTAGGAVTLAGGAFVLADPGDVDNIIKWDTGEEGRITAVGGGGLTATITPAPGAPISAGEFTLFRTNRTILVGELKRTNTYVTGFGFCQTSRVSDLISFRRTYLFSAEGGPVVYRELGVGWSTTPSAANTTFARFLPDGDIPVDTGEQLQITYELNLRVYPTTTLTATAVIDGWPVSPSTNTDGQYQLQYIGLHQVNSTGGSVQFDAADRCNEPGETANVGIWIQEGTAALTPFADPPPTRGGTAFTDLMQTPSLINGDFTGITYTQSKRITWTTTEAEGTLWRALGLGEFSGSTSNADSSAGFTFLFDQPQVKSNLHTLTIDFDFAWSRALSTLTI